MICENSQDRIEILKTVYKTVHKHIRDNEALENKVSFSVGTLFLLFAAFLLKEHIELDDLKKSIIGSMIAAICILTGTFLYDINRRIKTQCRMIVRIEKIFGLYESHYFTNQIPEKDRRCVPPQVFSNEASDWGEKQNRLFLYPHILGVIFSAIAAISSLFITLPNPNPQTQAKASERSIVTPGSTQAEKYFDIKPHLGQ